MNQKLPSWIFWQLISFWRLEGKLTSLPFFPFGRRPDPFCLEHLAGSTQRFSVPLEFFFVALASHLAVAFALFSISSRKLAVVFSESA